MPRFAKAVQPAQPTNGQHVIDSRMHRPEIGLRDVWILFFEYLVTDKYGNVTVPALAACAYLRLVCRAWRRCAAAITSPFDAIISWDRKGKRDGRPVKWSGGICFGEFVEAPALTIVRCKTNGRMFAISTDARPEDREAEEDPDADLRHKCRRFYPMSRLAQLLCGHTSDWELRLADLAYLQFHMSDTQPLAGRRLVSNCVDDCCDLRTRREPPAMDCFVEKDQKLTCTAMYGMDGIPRVVHDANFFSFCVDVEEAHNSRGKCVGRQYHKLNAIALVERKHRLLSDGTAECRGSSVIKYIHPEKAWEGKELAEFGFQRPHAVAIGGDCHQLSIALGMFAFPFQFSKTWLVSLFAHYDGIYALADWEIYSKAPSAERQRQKLRDEKLPTWHCADTEERTLKRMGVLAIKASEHLASTGAPVARTPRGSASRARQQMSRQSGPRPSAPKAEASKSETPPGDDDSEVEVIEASDSEVEDDGDEDYEESKEEAEEREEEEAEAEAEEEADEEADQEGHIAEVGEEEGKQSKVGKQKKQKEAKRDDEAERKGKKQKVEKAAPLSEADWKRITLEKALVALGKVI